MKNESMEVKKSVEKFLKCAPGPKKPAENDVEEEEKN